MASVLNIYDQLTGAEELYHGPHLHAALVCLDAGREDNARSWMERDLGELCLGAESMPMPGTLRKVGDFIAYTPIGQAIQGTNGDGI